MNPMFELAKNFIVEGLTYKIDAKEKNSLGKELTINIQSTSNTKDPLIHLPHRKKYPRQEILYLAYLNLLLLRNLASHLK